MSLRRCNSTNANRLFRTRPRCQNQRQSIDARPHAPTVGSRRQGRAPSMLKLQRWVADGSTPASSANRAVSGARNPFHYLNDRVNLSDSGGCQVSIKPTITKCSLDLPSLFVSQPPASRGTKELIRACAECIYTCHPVGKSSLCDYPPCSLV